MNCTSWPNNSNYGCSSDGDNWAKLDNTTFGKDECEFLCSQHASNEWWSMNGCCYVSQAYGCYWKGGATAIKHPNGAGLAVTCTASGELYCILTGHISEFINYLNMLATLHL